MKRVERGLGRLRIVCLIVGVFQACTAASQAQKPSDFVGYWHGRYTGNGVNVAVYFDRWIDDGKLRSVMTLAPFFVAYEEITYNSDGTLWTETPSILGVLEGTVAVSLATESDPAKTSRVTWKQSEGNVSGTGEFTWDPPALVKAATDSELTGQYQGVLWPGFAATERIDVSMDIQFQKDTVTGTIKLPVEELEIAKGRRLHNRVIFEVAGKTIRGIWAGDVTENGFHFHWDMGVGYGQAEFNKADSDSDGLNPH